MGETDTGTEPTVVAGPAGRLLHRWRSIPIHRRVAMIGSIVSLVAAGLSLATQLPRVGEHADLLVFAVGSEGSIPTWLSSGGLLLCGVLFYIVGYQEQGWRRLCWRLLAVGGIWASMDEAISAHERLDVVVQGVRDLESNAHDWVAAGAIIVALLGIVLFPFWLGLPRRDRIGFLLVGAIYFGGAVGVETLAGMEVARAGETVAYELITTVEETMEMVGISLLLALLVRRLTTEGDARAAFGGDFAGTSRVES